MELLKIIRNSVVVASLIIFCYQLYIALNNLMNEATVDSTENIPISNLDPLPLITFCPRQEVDLKFQTTGYSSIQHLTVGTMIVNE